MGTPQPWPVSKKNLNYVREAGVRQFISTYNRVKDFQGDELMWGDEVEYGVFILEKVDGVKKVKLSLRAKDVSDCAFGFSFALLPCRLFVATCHDL